MAQYTIAFIHRSAIRFTATNEGI